ncbi:hypothetical protein BFJ66_g15754 [Fusarium oxysporum f. sp. cepae]|uniref:Uncharacterized protein n=1 Tax=Fusarium oxysporum f. sp. cepae TaxID=396571 RepID=A0A3L6NVU0_FUSOX|nr:hypothetical protein BFJ65_g5805 [Fusarium oxysporum f. sp. cepae]RKK30510.1 hypothetical protein BFJ67_g15713 [Fusarium oxysporum f. sp. cepae]RKK31660.1 hypothetical protein BFJ66_g15754 [Fusarium oxysporum f. sp. cepae]
MEKVRKTFFDPLATSKGRIAELLQNLPVGSAHPFSPEGILLCRTKNGIEEIDISNYSQDYFFNSIDLGEMGEILLRRMKGFREHLAVFDDFQIMQAPAASFKIPIVSGQITILAVSERTPTYYDFCFADQDCNTCCWTERTTFSGIKHSGDLLNQQDLLDYVRIDNDTLTEKPICVFISGYTKTQITRFLGTHPALMVADHVDKILYIIPVPLDKATIGDATICCPLVIKRDEDSIICSILPKATTDRNMMCDSKKLISPCFPEAINSADFTISEPLPAAAAEEKKVEKNDEVESEVQVSDKRRAILTTDSSNLPSFLAASDAQIIRFSTGIEFMSSDADNTEQNKSAVVLPCIFGSQLQGPMLLSTGSTPSNVPFKDEKALCAYYEQLESIVVVVDERMTDNARNLASGLRMNTLFIVQIKTKEKHETEEEVSAVLSSANINAVTALAGPQSLIVANIGEKFYFYRGLANHKILDTTKLNFGEDITEIIMSNSVESLLAPKISRLVNLSDSNAIYLPYSAQVVRPRDLSQIFEGLSIAEINSMHDDITAAVPQLQALLSQKDLQQLSKTLVDTLSSKIDKKTAPLRSEYIAFITSNLRTDDQTILNKKNKMLGDLRKVNKELQTALEPVITSLANMISVQTTSKRTHDMKRLMRQTQIQNNVEATKSMTFESLTGLLEKHAEEMGVMLLNIETVPYKQMLAKLKGTTIDAKPCCALDDRILHLDGFDAGIIMEQSQSQHAGPLVSQAGPDHPILALPYLSQQRGVGSMLAWVCWDEFVNLKSPYTIRWMEKCNESHIAALRIMMRDTLSQAVASREYNFEAGSPEIGHLMSSLLMAAMSKLAAMRTSAPVVLDKAEDTVTRLMRGLFGNLMTIAGSGVRPLSMVWQLFGLNPQYDVPVMDADWVWYENVVELYPYTGWPLKTFNDNLLKLLDKIIVRVITKNENVAEIKQSKAYDMVHFCKLRNIQLEHCRTIITVFERMLTTDGLDVAAIAGRLQENIPSELEKQTKGYTRMMRYLGHLARGGARRPTDDLVYGNVYTKRSAAFKDLKIAVVLACQDKNWDVAKENCQAVLDLHKEIAAKWQIQPEQLKVQNIHYYRELIDADVSEDADQEVKNRTRKIVGRIMDDAEKKRIPWQVGNDAAKNNVEPLDEQFLEQVLTGTRPETETKAVVEVAKEEPVEEESFATYKSSLAPTFVSAMEKALSAEDVCAITKIPESSMRVFIKALNPEFEWDDLAQQFKIVILSLLRERSGRIESRPAARMLRLR